MCVDCYQAYASRNTALQLFGDPNWKENAAKAGLNLWDQLPGETNKDYALLKQYMSYYPEQRPTLKRVSDDTGVSYHKVVDTARRCHFSERLNAWMQECDRATMHQRRNEIVNMNLENIRIATSIRSKIGAALDLLQPSDLNAKDIASLTKLATEMERDARANNIEQEELRAELAKADGSKDLKRNKTSEEDLGEVLSVLLNSGALNEGTIGLRITNDSNGSTTKEIVVQSTNSDVSNIEVEANVED
jgi:hypothetical protein